MQLMNTAFDDDEKLPPQHISDSAEVENRREGFALSKRDGARQVVRCPLLN